MTGQRVRRHPIHVEKSKNWIGRVVWVWGCDDHPRHRGYHHTDRWSDRWRRSNGHPPDAHPFLRCMDGANRHWHKHHSVCICAVTHGPEVSREPRADSRESKDDLRNGDTG